ncbi:MAG TPA: DUF4124 domain-containing protein [Ramlibacter sp.]|jgi:hypothetical protein
MKALRLTLLALACSAPLLAAGQPWVWLDETGRKVFSDTAPPPSIGSKRIIRQPGGLPPPVEPVAASVEATPVAAAAASAPKPAAPRLSGKDAALEEKKKQAEAAEAEKKKAEEAKLAQLKDTNCKRARASKADLTSGIRLARTNAKGEREIMDEAARAAEIKHLDAVMATDCRIPQ